MTEQLEAHAPYVAFIAFAVVVAVVCTVSAVVDAARHRSPRR